MAELIARKDERLKLDSHLARKLDALPDFRLRDLTRTPFVAEDYVREGVASNVVFWLCRENLLDHIAAIPERLRAQVFARIKLVPVALKPGVTRPRHVGVLDASARLAS